MGPRRQQQTDQTTLLHSSSAIMSILLLFGSAVIVTTSAASNISGPQDSFQQPAMDWSQSPYKIIIDGGSTGSRLRVFEFVDMDSDVKINVGIDEDMGEEQLPIQTPARNTECISRGSLSVNIPMSSFGRLQSEQQPHSSPINATEVAQHILPLFDYASTVIPPQYYNSTRVLYLATAGMRLLEPGEQEAVYDALHAGLLQTPSFVFRNLQRSDLRTLSGELEGFYGAIAVNYLKGVINTNLQLTATTNEEEEAVQAPSRQTDKIDEQQQQPLGALDMGGSSTQIVFSTSDGNENSAAAGSNDGDQTCGTNYDYTAEADACVAPGAQPSTLQHDNFFKTSYLSYGVDQFRHRMYRAWIAERQQQQQDEQDEARCEQQHDGSEQQCHSNIIFNPCGNPGNEQEYEGHVFLGTGNVDACVAQVKRFIPHASLPHDGDADFETERMIGGIEHPPIRGKFLAMSLYFFALDSLRVFSGNEILERTWPTPTLNELHDALDGLCSRSWHDDLSITTTNHRFTRSTSLPHRCMESVYMTTLLRHGYGFDPESRDITFTFLVNDSEVEWTLGMALAMHAAPPSANVKPKRADDTARRNATYHRKAAEFVAHSAIHTHFYPESL